MNALEQLLAAYAISQGTHTGGHFYQANNPGNPMRDVPMRLNPQELVEEWNIPDDWQPARPGGAYNALHMPYEDYLADNNRKAADIHGAGFAMQDRIGNALQGTEIQRPVLGMNALIKGLYLSGAPMKLSQQLNQSGGDIGGLERTTGNNYIKELLAASALWDAIRAYSGVGTGKNALQVGFDTFDNGTPGIIFTKHW